MAWSTGTASAMAAAVVFEVAWVLGMKASQGFTRGWITAGTAIAYILSVVFLSIAARRMDVSVAYAVWAGCGTLLVGVLAVLVFKEHMSVLRGVSFALVIVGIVGLNLAERPRAGGGVIPPSAAQSMPHSAVP